MGLVGCVPATNACQAVVCTRGCTCAAKLVPKQGLLCFSLCKWPFPNTVLVCTSDVVECCTTSRLGVNEASCPPPDWNEFCTGLYRLVPAHQNPKAAQKFGLYKTCALVVQVCTDLYTSAGVTKPQSSGCTTLYVGCTGLYSLVRRCRHPDTPPHPKSLDCTNLYTGCRVLCTVQNML
jgi:hypothetical protein